jgi:hypothetical protein
VGWALSLSASVHWPPPRRFFFIPVFALDGDGSFPGRWVPKASSSFPGFALLERARGMTLLGRSGFSPSLGLRPIMLCFV